MKNLNRILFSLIASVVDENAKCKMQNAELDAKTISSVYAHAKRHDLCHLLAGAVRENAKCRMQNAELDEALTPGELRESGERAVETGGLDVPQKASHSGRGVGTATVGTDGPQKASHFGRGVGTADGEGTPDLMQTLERAELTAVWRVRNIENEQGRVRKCLEEAGIPFILLKGAVMRSYYPAAWMRTSSDIDVLVPKGELARAIAVIEENLGYEISTTEPHDASLYSKSRVHLDMHTLFEGDKEDESLLTAAWRDASEAGGAEKFLTPEHFYFYHVAHMAEHVRNGGCGIRPFIDLYLLNAKLDLDRARVEALLTEYGLGRFEAMAVQLSESWMRGTESEALESFEEYILAGGVYGTIAQTVAAKRRDGQGKLGYLMHRIFMPYSELKERHPRLDGRPWLTPFFEIWRWCGLAVPSRFKRSRKELKNASFVDSDKVTAVKELFDTLGL